MTLKVSHVTKSFGGLQVLTDISFTVDIGEVFGLIGPNGAGKTTLFNLMTGFVKPDAGMAELDGTPLFGKRPHHINRLGLVRTFQVVKPFSGLTVRENVMVAALSRGTSMAVARKEADTHLQELALSRWASQPASALPLPARKRLELARALATRPRFLLLDEVMGGLRPDETYALVDVIRAVHAQGVGVVIIEHNMTATMALCDRILVLNNGHPIATGTPQEIVRHPDVIRAYLGAEETDA